MNTSQLPFLVEGILIFIAMIFGMLIGKAGKPYGKGKLSIHLFFFVWFSTGFGFILHGLLKIASPRLIWIPVAIMVVAIVTQFVTGISMMVLKRAENTLPMAHKISAILLLVADLGAFIIAG